MNNINVNIDTLRGYVSNFVEQTRPTNTDGSAPCTIADLNNLISKIDSLFNLFINELDDNMKI